MMALDLFSAAAGGWSLGLHRAGFRTMAACEFVDWRRALYAQNNPGVPIYDDVRTLTADRLRADLGRLPDIVVGSPPCQDISSANTKGKGVEGERSGLYFEAIRIIGECRPRWFALENSSNLRTRGADAVIAALEAIGYTCWSFVVRASDIGANHERPRSWLIGCNLAQVAEPHGDRRTFGRQGRRVGSDLSVPHDPLDPARVGHEGGRTWGHGPDGNGAAYAAHAYSGGEHASPVHAEVVQLPGLVGDCSRHAADAYRGEQREQSGRGHGPGWSGAALNTNDDPSDDAGATPDSDQAGQADGCLEPGVRQAKIADDGCGDGRSPDGPCARQVDLCPSDSGHPDGPWPLWSLADLAGRLRLDDGLPARVAGTRVALGTPRGSSAASLIVEAYGDAVVPQIPEAIGRAILRVEAALSAILPERIAA